MSTSGSGVITKLLRRRKTGDSKAEDELFRHVYENLHQMAARRLRAERRNHTLQPTALIHEAYLALTRGDAVDFADRMHFYAVAGQVMRRILIDYARQKKAQRRQLENQHRVDLDKAQVFSLEDPEFLLALDKSLNRLKELSERACKVVELHMFIGLGLEDIAKSFNVNERTIKRDWQMAKLWLRKDLYGPSGNDVSTLG